MNSPEGGPQAECEFRPLSGTNILQTPYNGFGLNHHFPPSKFSFIGCKSPVSG